MYKYFRLLFYSAVLVVGWFFLLLAVEELLAYMVLSFGALLISVFAIPLPFAWFLKFRNRNYDYEAVQKRQLSFFGFLFYLLVVGIGWYFLFVLSNMSFK